MEIRIKGYDITHEIKKDPDLRRAYNDNIAMAFKDTYHRYKKKTGKKTMSRKDIHIIANDAAKYFLDLWCEIEGI